MQSNPLPVTTKDLLQKAIQANRDHQYTLNVYTERLEKELASVDKLLNAIETADDEDEPELDVGGFVLIPGSVKAVGPISLHDLISQDSPFCEDAEKRNRYLGFTSIHPMKAKEIDTLAEAVRTENYRKHAFEAQKQGLELFSSHDHRSQNALEVNKEGLDWERVAEKVSSMSSVPRTARECEIRWLGDRHPQINHSPWDEDELLKLNTILGDYPGRVNWVSVAQRLGTNRTPIDCMRNGTHRKHHVWTPESDSRLSEAVKTYGADNWILVARYVSEDTTAPQCQSRYTRTLDPKLKRGPWSSSEDDQLRFAVSVFGNSWIEVASVIEGRNNEQCRDRWSDKIKPNVVRGKWKEEEDIKLLEAVSAIGEKWKEISEIFGGSRTDSMCRNRYGLLREKIPKAFTAVQPIVGPSRMTSNQPQGAYEGILDFVSSSPNTEDNSQNPPITFVSNQHTQPPPRRKPKTRAKRTTKSLDKGTEGAQSSGANMPVQNHNPESEVPRPRPKPKLLAKGKGKDAAVQIGSSTGDEGDGVSKGKEKEVGSSTACLPTGNSAKRVSAANGSPDIPSKRQRKSSNPTAPEWDRTPIPLDDQYVLRQEQMNAELPGVHAVSTVIDSTSSSQELPPDATALATAQSKDSEKVPAKAGKPGRVSVTPTRKQPARAASRKSIPY